MGNYISNKTDRDYILGGIIKEANIVGDILGGVAKSLKQTGKNVASDVIGATIDTAAPTVQKAMMRRSKVDLANNLRKQHSALKNELDTLRNTGADAAAISKAEQALNTFKKKTQKVYKSDKLTKMTDRNTRRLQTEATNTIQNAGSQAVKGDFAGAKTTVENFMNANKDVVNASAAGDILTGNPITKNLKQNVTSKFNETLGDIAKGDFDAAMGRWISPSNTPSQLKSFSSKVDAAGQGGMAGRFLGGSKLKAMDAESTGKVLTGKALADRDAEALKVYGTRAGVGAAGLVGANALLSNRKSNNPYGM